MYHFFAATAESAENCLESVEKKLTADFSLTGATFTVVVSQQRPLFEISCFLDSNYWTPATASLFEEHFPRASVEEKLAEVNVNPLEATMVAIQLETLMEAEVRWLRKISDGGLLRFTQAEGLTYVEKLPAGDFLA